MKVYTAVWNENGKAGQKSFVTLTTARDFAEAKVRSEDCSPVAVWEYTMDCSPAEALATAHDRAQWWSAKKYRGCALKNGSWTTR